MLLHHKQPSTHHSQVQRIALLWSVVTLLGFFVLPWYLLEEGLWSFEWLFDGYPFDSDYAPAAFLIWQEEKRWLAPLFPILLAPLSLFFFKPDARTTSNILCGVGALALSYLLLQGFLIGIRGWNSEWIASVFGELGDRQFGFGYGAMFVALGSLFLLTTGIAIRGAINGDVFVVGAVGFVSA